MDKNLIIQEEGEMKTKKMIVMVMALVFCVGVIFSGTASAASWLIYTVVESQVLDDGSVKIKLYSEPKDQAKVFLAPTGQENQMLSIALTAMSAGMQVKALVYWQSPGSDIVGIKLIANQ